MGRLQALLALLLGLLCRPHRAAPLPLPRRGDLLSERTQVRSRVRESHVSTFRDPSSRQRAGEPARPSRSSKIVGCSHRAAVSMGIGGFLSSPQKVGSNTLNLNITWQKILAFEI